MAIQKLFIKAVTVFLFCEFISIEGFPFWWNIKPIGQYFCPTTSTSDHVCYDLQLTKENCTRTVQNVCPQYGHGHHHHHKRGISIYKFSIISGPCYHREKRTCVNYRCQERCCKGWQRGENGQCNLPADWIVQECRNGGTPIGTKCTCPRHYTGPRCEEAICEQKCQNGGQCFGNDTAGIPICVCGSNFTGEFCQTPVCGRGCLNNGSCEADGFNAKCVCPTGYHGDRCQNKTKIKRCRYIPPWYNTRCADRCSENRHCQEGEYCCEFNGEKICLVQKKYAHQQCIYRDHLNEMKYVSVGDTFFNYYNNLCRCRPIAANRLDGSTSNYGNRDCSVMPCNLQNNNCKTALADDGNQNMSGNGRSYYRKPAIVNCPLPGDHLPVYVDNYSSVALFNFRFDARDFRGKRLNTIILQHIFNARNMSGPDIYHNKVTSVPDIRNNSAECCFTVEVIDNTPPRFLSCPADISAFTGETITWIKPKAVDNVGVSRIIEPFVTNGTLIGPGVHVFTYTAEDWSGNSAQCSFSVQVTNWNSNSNRWSERLRSRVEPNTAVVIGGTVVAVLAIVMMILVGVIIRSCRVRARNERRLSMHLRNARINRENNRENNKQRRMSVYSIMNEPPPYDVAARDKLPEYKPRDDPPIYTEREGAINENESRLEGCDNPTYGRSVNCIENHHHQNE